MNAILQSASEARRFPWLAPHELAPRVDNAVGLAQNTGSALAFQALVAKWRGPGAPTKEVCKSLFSAFRQKRSFPLVIVLNGDAGRTWVFGPVEDGAVQGPLDEGQVARILGAAFAEANPVAARKIVVHYFDSLATSSMPGVTNTGLFASHYLRTSVPERSDWQELTERAGTLLGVRGEPLIRGLGYLSTREGSTALVLRNQAQAERAVAVLLQDNESFSQPSERFLNSPVAHALAIAQAREIQWVIALRSSQIRLYSAKASEGVGRKGQSETYLEIDLAVVDPKFQALLPLVFSAEALSPGGSIEQLLRDSSIYTVELGRRLRTRVYEEVVPVLSVEVARQMQAKGMDLDHRGIEVAYGATLRILFRLLFQAYGEDRGLLPYGRNEVYDRHALKTIAQELLDPASVDPGDQSTAYWNEMRLAWEVIDKGDHAWGVPAYNGGLFSDTDPEGKVLAEISIPNSVFKAALRSLLVDLRDNGYPGPVDFRSLSVREFGTIYEGLLESSITIAETDLTLDRNQTWVPAKAGDAIEAREGEPYLHNSSGARKATGSYFTPSFIVDHLIGQSLVPALEAHLERVEAKIEEDDLPAAGEMFFDFRVADLAMGSGHFLVAAIDHIEQMMAAFLDRHDIPKVTQELLFLRQAAEEALGELAPDVELERTSLLRRQIARRCIYGLDINPIAVELARVAIWIHSFVPGLAMSSLNHNLVYGNSLTGIGTIDEAIDELDPPQQRGKRRYESLFRPVIERALEEASTLLQEAAVAAEVTAEDVRAAARLARDARAKAEPSRALFDAAVALRIGLLDRSLSNDEEALIRHVADPQVRETLESLAPAHMPLLFPEVFLRQNGGFDTIVGNPPWAEVKLDAQRWWAIVDPGIMGLNVTQKSARIAYLEMIRPDLAAALDRELETRRLISKVLQSGPFPGMSTGDVDVYKAFAWRFLQLVRDDGGVGVLLPRGAFTGKGSEPWRRAIFEGYSVDQITFLINKGRWIFDVDERYEIALASLRRSPSRFVNFVGPFRSREELDEGGSQRRIPFDWFETWTSDLSVPQLPSRESTEVFLQLRRSPRLDSTDQFEFRPYSEFHMTNDAWLWRDVQQSDETVPVFASASFDIWSPDSGYPFGYAPLATVTAELLKRMKRQVKMASSPFFGMDPNQGPSDLPLFQPRIAYGLRARSTDTRTMTACLVPPKTALTNAAPYFVRRAGTLGDEAFLLGILSSIVFDWYARKFVDQNFNFFLLNPMPVPRPEPRDPLRLRVVEVAGRLAAVDDRYADWAEAVGVGVGTVKEAAEKNDLIAELDALAALLYGLDEAQLTTVFETFHIGWDYQARLDAVLEHYRSWAKVDR